MAPSARSFVGVLRLMVAVAVAVVAVMASRTSAWQWKIGTGGLVYYAHDCDFFGKDLVQVSSLLPSCGGLCVDAMGCTHFTWNKGTCFLKKDGIRFSDATYYKGAVCGKRR